MHYQKLFPFAPAQQEFQAAGILSAEKYFRRTFSKEYVAKIQHDPKWTAECSRIEEMLRVEPSAKKIEDMSVQEFAARINAPEEEKPVLGTVKLLPAAAKYFPENFMPQQWEDAAKLLKPDRNVYTLDALCRDGTRKKIMLKEPKTSYTGVYAPPEDWLTQISDIHVYKTSPKEIEHLIRLQQAGVLVEPPLGSFSFGHEQYAYTEFVQGVSPLDVLAGTTRKKLWDADARMLARMCKAHIKQQGFYSQEFDDKLWTNKGLALIDTDEAFDLSEGLVSGSVKKSQIGKYHEAWLVDCLHEYLDRKLMSEAEAVRYAEVFLQEKGAGKGQARTLVERAKTLEMTEESYVGMMMDTD